MEQKTIRDIDEKAARIKRDVVDPQTVLRGGAVVGVLLGIACAVYLYYTEARGSDSFYLTLICAVAGGFLGYQLARGVLFLREAFHDLCGWAARRRKSTANYRDNAEG